MKIKTARSSLSIIWVVGSVPIILIVNLQTLNQTYGDAQNWDKGWMWIMPLIFPTLGSIIGSWSVGDNKVDNLEVASKSAFVLTVILSVLYLSTMYSGLIVGSVSYRHSNWDYVIRATNWFLTAFQGLLSIALTKFFIENIRPK